MICPWVDHCVGRDIAKACRRAVPPDKPTRRGVVYWIERPDGAVLIGRAPKRVLGGDEFPSTAWREDMNEDISDVSRHAIAAATQWSAESGHVRHGLRISISNYGAEGRSGRARLHLTTCCGVQSIRLRTSV